LIAQSRNLKTDPGLFKGHKPIHSPRRLGDEWMYIHSLRKHSFYPWNIMSVRACPGPIQSVT
jgi:hypothetical protein